MRFERLVLILGLLAGTAAADPFTGPTSAYYLDNYANRTIYVVQGTSIINSFAWAYGADSNGNTENEDTLAVSSTVNTRPFYAGSSSGSGGQYTLAGTPTGTTEAYPLPAGTAGEYSYDGTSDGTNNYYVEYYGYGNGTYTENVYQTDLTWQNPTKLFSVQSFAGYTGEYLGSAYDRTNNSLWISGWSDQTIRDYSLNGTLLSSFNTGQCCQDALGYDVADNTLWISSLETNTLDQYSTTGTLLQSGTPTGLPSGSYLAGDFASSAAVPEPASILLLGTVAGTLLYSIRRKRFSA